MNKKTWIALILVTCMLLSAYSIEPILHLSVDPFTHISEESLFGYMADLSDIQAYSGWRSSGTEGEREAHDYVETTVKSFEYLQELGVEIERQPFRIPWATEYWEMSLEVMVGGKPVQIPVSGLRARSDNVDTLKNFDTDGKINDVEHNPVTVDALATVIRTDEEIDTVELHKATQKILFVDYDLIYCQEKECRFDTLLRQWNLIYERPLGIVVVTHNSSKRADNHGAFVADSLDLSYIDRNAQVPVVYARIEDIEKAGIKGWQNIRKIESATLVWDADVFLPGKSENLMVKIPGVDSSRSIMLTAHIDSPNDPGAMDNGSGSAILLEIARVLNETQTQPPVDLYLTWFGSEEIGLNGSQYFAATHQEFVESLMAIFNIDCLIKPLNGLHPRIYIANRSYSFYGIEGQTWADTFARVAARHQVDAVPMNDPYLAGDNFSFAGFDVPNVIMTHLDMSEIEAGESMHFGGMIHSPYDTVETARSSSDAFVDMATAALAAAIDVPKEGTLTRVTPRPEHRILFVGSHTEFLGVTPVGLVESSMAFAAKGYDVDLIPYGQPITTTDLVDVDIVVALPVCDYPTKDSEKELMKYSEEDYYDEAWTKEEIDVLVEYVDKGGFLVLTNSTWTENDDLNDTNAIARPFGILYTDSSNRQMIGEVVADHPLVEGIRYLFMASGGGVVFKHKEGILLAETEKKTPVLFLTDYGEEGGQVLVFADYTLLADESGKMTNLPFWNNLANYAISR